jgi:hypothetical protein
MSNKLKIEDVVNDTAGYPGEVVDVISDTLVKVKWEDGTMTLEHTINLTKV